MFLKDSRSGDMMRIEDLESLFNPFKSVVSGRGQPGEEEQDSEEFQKDQLVFLSGERLPRYCNNCELRHHRQTNDSLPQ